MPASQIMVAEEQRALRKIRQSHFFFWTIMSLYAPLVWIVIRHPDLRTITLPFALLWTVGFAYFVLRAAMSRCPRCGHYFHSRTAEPAFIHLATQRCLHCGLPLRVKPVIYPGLQ